MGESGVFVRGRECEAAGSVEEVSVSEAAGRARILVFEGVLRVFSLINAMC